MYHTDFNEKSLVEREMPSAMDIKRLIAEVHKRPGLWDVRCGEHKARYYIPNLWKEVATCVGSNVTVEKCKRKWKNLRDAYRAEVRRTERRMERVKIMGQYDRSTNYTSKWIYFADMSYISDSKRPRYTIEYENINSNDNIAQEQNNDNHSKMYDIKLETEHHDGLQDDVKYVVHTPDDGDDEEANDVLFKEFQNLVTPQAVGKLSETIHLANSLAHNSEYNSKHNFQENIQHTLQDNTPDTTTTPLKSENCSNCADDQVHFLEDLEKEENILITSTRKDITRNSKLDHVGDSDYNFLVSFLPQMKKMIELENLQFRAQMCEEVLNILVPSISKIPSPVPTLLIPWNCGNNMPYITYQPADSTGNGIIDKETDRTNNTATSTIFNDFD